MINNINFNKNNIVNPKTLAKMEGLSHLSLKEGQIIKGKIIEVDNHHIKLLMEDGQLLSGILVDLEGLILDIERAFYVEKSSKNLLILKLVDQDQKSPLFENTENTISKNELIKNILENNNLLINDLNNKIVEELLNHHMPLDKKTILYFIRQAHNIHNVSISTLITMKKYEIPINKDNLIHFEKLFYESSSFHNQFQKLIDTFIYEDIGDTSLHLDNILKENFLIINSLSPDEIPLNQVISKEDSIDLVKDLKNLVDGKDRSDSKYSLPFDPSFKVGPSKEIMTSKILNDIRSVIQIYLKNNDEVIHRDNILIDFLQSNGYKNLLRQLLTYKYYPTIDQLKDTQRWLEPIKKVEEELNDLKKEIEQIKETSSKVQDLNINKEASPYTLAQNQINNKVDFMANLYKHVPFLQVPIQILQNKGKGDLYVFTNKKRGNNLPLEDLKVILRLDMKHLGRINAKIHLKNKNVYTRFYTENDLSYEILSSHLNVLEKLLQEKGFHTKSKVLKSDKMDLEVSSLLKDDNTSMISTYTFDTKV